MEGRQEGGGWKRFSSSPSCLTSSLIFPSHPPPLRLFHFLFALPIPSCSFVCFFLSCYSSLEVFSFILRSSTFLSSLLSSVSFTFSSPLFSLLHLYFSSCVASSFLLPLSSSSLLFSSLSLSFLCSPITSFYRLISSPIYHVPSLSLLSIPYFSPSFPPPFISFTSFPSFPSSP